MPFTRNTRIQVVTKAHTTEYTAQVEYKYPITGNTVWEDFDKVEYGGWFWLIGQTPQLPWKADSDCHHNIELDEVSGMDWAKAVIDQYHKLFDEQEFPPIVKYVKYP
jgi:hypothetical protein